MRRRAHIDMTPSAGIFVVLVPLIAWRVYVRVRRQLGRQRLIARRHWAAAIFFPVLLVVLGLSALPMPMALMGLAVGAAAGVALAIFGLRLTQFEATVDGLFYTPNAYIGLVLAVALAARILYRLFQVYGAAGITTPVMAQDLGRSPLTLLIVAIVCGYYSAYSFGILRWRRVELNENATRAP